MPRPKKTDQPSSRTPLLNTRLSAGDYVKLEKVCRLEGKSKTEVLRKAVLKYLDSYDQDAETAPRDRLAETLQAMDVQRKKDIERLAKLIVRATLDIGIVNQVFYKRAAKDDRDKLWDAARTAALERLRFKRKDGDDEVTGVLRDVPHSSEG